MKKIYIVLTQTGTLLSRTIKLCTGKKYNHVSIALDEQLKELYSFGRLNPYNAFIGGFVHEGIDFGTFKRFYKTETQIFEKEVTDEQYDRLKQNIATIEREKDKYRFNLKGLALAGIHKAYTPENKFFCSQFVRYIMKCSDIDISSIPETPQPEDFKMLDGINLIYNGQLRFYPEKHFGKETGEPR